MLKFALRELRYHPSRFAAVVIAVAISVGFMVAASGITATMQETTALQKTAYLSKSDVSFTIANPDGPAADSEQLSRELKSIDSVTGAEFLKAFPDATDFAGHSEFVNYFALPSEQFRWSTLTAGSWPANADEIVLGKTAVEAFRAKIGDLVTLTGIGKDFKLVGVSDDIVSMNTQTGYVTPQSFAANFSGGTGGIWLVQTANPDVADKVAAEIKLHFGDTIDSDSLQTREQALAAARNSIAGNFQVWKWVLWTFACIAMVVGMITISNTFSILLAGRRRQIGLLRAVGASGNKIRISVFLESLLLSVIGVGAGILLGYLATLVGAGILGMLGVGVSLPVNDALVSGLLGIVITLIAAFVPTLKATRVSPLEALRQSTAQDEKRVGIVRAILCGILVILGGATIALGLQAGSFALLAAVAGSALLAIGILFGAPLFVPVLLKGIVAVISRFGPLPRLAAKNVIRSPRRSAATATALMLAIGLIVTMQVATATLRENFLSQIVNRYPIDVSVTTLPEGNAAIPADTQNQLLAVDGVGAAVTLMGAVLPAPDGDDSNSSVLALAFDAAIFDVVKLSPYALPDDSVFVSPQLAQSAPTIKFGSLELRTIGVPFAGNATYIINRLNLERIVAAAGSDKYDIQARAMWFSVPDRSMATSVYVDVNRITQGQTGLLVGGSIADAAGVEGMLFMLMAVVTALLGVAVLIALVGVSNTLTLSVMERKRESALMRALGLQKSSLRLMLFFEALLLSGVGAIVGIAAGVFFGWIGVVALNATMGLAGSALSVDIVWTVVLLVAAIAVAGLASLIPGRRAANAPPVAALADL